MNIVFAGGGTGGHLYPAIALADALRRRHANVAFIGTAGRLEATIVPHAGYPLHAVASRPLVRAGGAAGAFELLRSAAGNAAGTLQSLVLLAKLHPDAVIATGGYVCLPVVLAARVLQLTGRFRGPIALLEPNAQPGLTNRLLAPLVTEVWGAFANPDARFDGKYVRTGVPVRGSLRALPSRDEAMARLGLDPALRTLLALGGSQGARSINDALIGLQAQPGLPAGWQLVHVTGRAEYERVRAALAPASACVFAYLDDPSDAFAAADLVLARAGASTLAELAALGKPAILVPYPFASEDHQSANAAAFAASGAAVVVPDAELSAQLAAVLAEATAPQRFSALQAGVRSLAGADPVATIIARVDALVSRRVPR